ncbi:MAG: NAD(P)/FAD-dependent oxidoreductase [Mycoplasmoidaceae bacterium]
MMISRDVLIIGGGPGGMYSSIIGGLINVSSIIVESNDNLGGQPMQLYAEKDIHDYPGFLNIKPYVFTEGMIEQIESFPDKIKVFLKTTILEILKDGEYFLTRLSNDEIVKTKFIIIATGSGSFSPVKSDLLKKVNYSNIHYVFQGENNYKDKKIVILGGGDSALDWANYLKEKNVSNDVTLVHRRDEFRARQEKIDKLYLNKTKMYLNYDLSKILKNNIFIKGIESNEEINLKYDFLLVQYGQEIKKLSDIEILKKIKRNRINKIIIDINCKTNVENIYAIGNSNHFESKPNLIISAMAEGATAIYSIRTKIRENM